MTNDEIKMAMYVGTGDYMLPRLCNTNHSIRPTIPLFSGVMPFYWLTHCRSTCVVKWRPNRPTFYYLYSLQGNWIMMNDTLKFIKELWKL